MNQKTWLWPCGTTKVHKATSKKTVDRFSLLCFIRVNTVSNDQPAPGKFFKNGFMGVGLMSRALGS